MKRIVLAALAAALAMFSLAGFYTGVLARAFIASHIDRRCCARHQTWLWSSRDTRFLPC